MRDRLATFVLAVLTAALPGQARRPRRLTIEPRETAAKRAPSLTFGDD